MTAPSRRAPGPISAPRPTTVPPISTAPGATDAPSCTSFSPRWPVQRRRRRDAAHQVGRAAHEVLGRAHVAPVAWSRRSRTPCSPSASSAGNTSRSTDTSRPARDAVDDLALEHVAARVDLVGRRVLGLLQERRHPAVGVGGHAAERARIADPHQVQRHVGVVARGGWRAARRRSAPDSTSPLKTITVSSRSFGATLRDPAAGAQRLRPRRRTRSAGRAWSRRRTPTRTPPP